MPYPFVCSVSLLIHNLISWSQIKSLFYSGCHTLSCRLLELYALFITHPPLHGVYPYIFENLCSLGALLLLRFLSFYLKAKQTNLSFHFFPLLGLWFHIYWMRFSLSVFILFINFCRCWVFFSHELTCLFRRICSFYVVCKNYFYLMFAHCSSGPSPASLFFPSQHQIPIFLKSSFAEF